MTYTDPAGVAYGAGVETVGSVSLSVVPTRTTPAGTPLSFTPDALLGISTPGSDALPVVEVSGTVTVPLAAQFSCVD